MGENKPEAAVRICQPGLLLTAGMLVGKPAGVFTMKEEWLSDPVILAP